MSLRFILPSITSGANVKTTIQQDLETGLGLQWKEDISDFVAPASVPFNDRSYAIAEQDPNLSSVKYYGRIDFKNTSYTGPIFIGYHDTDDSNEILFDEVRYVRLENDLSFTIADDRVNNQVAKIMIFELSRRTDKTFAAKRSIAISTKDDSDFTFDLPSIVPAGQVVSKILSVQVTPANELAVVVAGPQGAYPILSMAGGQIAGKDYVVSCVALMNTGDQLSCEGTFNCVA